MDSVHGTIAASNVAEVYDLDDDYPVVLIVNEESGANVASLFVTVGSADQDPAVPVADAAGTIQVRPGERFPVAVLASGRTRVRIVCSDLEPFSIYGFEAGEFAGA